MKKNFIDKTPKEIRTRNYATVVYEESAPKNWLYVLEQQFVPAFVSPLHDRDVNPTKEPKKPHWHVIIMFDSVKTKKQAKELFDKIGGIGVETVQSLRGYVRYLCHLDNPEKAPYDPTKVICFCGADYYDVISLVTDKYKTLREITQYCKDQKVYSFSDLWEFCEENRPDWFRTLVENAVAVKEYIKSRNWTNR